MGDTRCSACTHPDVDELEDALRTGTPARAVARRYGIGRGVLARHLRHVAGPASPVPGFADARTTTERILAAAEEALNALDRAEASGRLPLVLAALKGARAAARQLRRGYQEDYASDTDRARLEVLYQRGVAAYSRSIGRGQVELSALEGLRQTLDDLREAAGAVEGEVIFRFYDFDHTHYRDVVIPASKLPPRYRQGGEDIQIQLEWPGPHEHEPGPHESFEPEPPGPWAGNGGQHGANEPST